MDDDELRKLILECKHNVKFKDFNIHRWLAKNNRVRLVWRIAKETNAPIFEGLVSEWDMNKLSLCYWLQLYDSVSEAYKRPPQEIVDDDELLDRWLEEQGDEDRRERQKEWRSGSGKMDTAYRHDEVLEIQEA